MEIKNYEMQIRNLLALCYIIDDLPVFEKNLRKYLSNINDIYRKSWMLKLIKVTNGDKVFNSKKEKKFYIENKKVIDTINRISMINYFICDNYNLYNNYESECQRKAGIQFFYNYILNNKENLDKIIELLEKISSLGFIMIEFNCDSNFTDQEYTVNTLFQENKYIEYLDNIEVIPTYDSNNITYKTTHSNYKIQLGIDKGDISSWNRTILVNSLLFHPDNLPKSLSKKDTYDVIVELKEAKEKAYNDIRTSIDVSVSVEYLDISLELTKENMEKIINAKNKDELLRALTSIKENIEKLKEIGTEYDKNIMTENSSITKKTLEKEKNKHSIRK